MNLLKNIFGIISLVIALTLISCESIKDQSTNNIKHNFSSLVEDFKTPPVEYSSAPFWVWNDEVTRDKIDRQLPEFKKQGISQVFIHPRPGLITEYLSDEWFELCKYAVDKGKELDMKIWLYDEKFLSQWFCRRTCDFRYASFL